MKPIRRTRSRHPTPARRIAELRARLETAEETIRAIRDGEVDAVVVTDKGGARVYTLHGAEHAYRVLIESMNEGALTLAPDQTILYVNRAFAKMVRRPLEQVIGTSFRTFLAPEDRAAFKPLLLVPAKSGSRTQILLRPAHGSPIPVLVSIRPLGNDAFAVGTVGMVVTDMTEAHRSEEQLRELAKRLMTVQETERARVALQLHDRVTQLLCAIVVRTQSLADRLSPLNGRENQDAIRLRDLVGKAAGEVEDISRELRPSLLDHLGLASVLRIESAEFSDRTRIPVAVTYDPSVDRLPAGAELACYRIFQAALENVERHADAGNVAVGLARDEDFVEMSVGDDGAGFDAAARSSSSRKTQRGFGLFAMRERAVAAGCHFEIESSPGHGTVVRVRIPMALGRTPFVPIPEFP